MEATLRNALNSAYTSVTGDDKSKVAFTQNAAALASEARSRLSDGLKPKMTVKLAMSFLKSHPTSQSHRPIRKRFQRSPIYGKNVDFVWQTDTADMSDFASANDNKRRLIVFIDCFSRYANCRMLKSATAAETLKAFKSILHEMNPRKPEKVCSDQGSEYKNVFDRYCKENSIHNYTTNDPATKAAIAERFFRSIKGWLHKYMTEYQTSRFIDVLPEIVMSYNLRHHRSLPKGFTPALASLPKNHDIVYEHLYTKRYMERTNDRFNFMIGDAVTIPKLALFYKGFRSNWSAEPFFIHSKITGRPVRYKLNDSRGLTVRGSYYEHKEYQVVFEKRPKYNYWVSEQLLNAAKIRQTDTKNRVSNAKDNSRQRTPANTANVDHNSTNSVSGRRPRTIKKHKCSFC